MRDFISSRIIPAIDGGVSKSDDCVHTRKKHGLQQAANRFRKGAVRSHPTHTQIHDIVDPYMFSIRLLNDENYGQRCVPNEGLYRAMWSRMASQKGTMSKKTDICIPTI